MRSFSVRILVSTRARYWHVLVVVGTLQKTRTACAVRVLISTGAAYRIRTCDVLIRSQTLYPAEVTPQRTEYIATYHALRQGI